MTGKFCWAEARDPRSVQVRRNTHALRDLAPYWLSETALDNAVKDRLITRRITSLPCDVGNCFVLIANKDKATYPTLHSGLILPLCWRSASQPELPSLDSRLPRAFQGVAENAKTVAKELLGGNNDVDGFTLGFPIHGQWPDLSGLPDEGSGFPSAFGALLVGILSRLLKVPPRHDVFASVAWNGRVRPVGDLDTKLALAKRWGARELHVVDPPEGGESIWRRIEDVPRPEVALRGLLHAALMDPCELWPPVDRWADDRSKEVMLSYHRLVRKFDPRRAGRFYQDRLIRPIARAVAEEFAARPENANTHRTPKQLRGRHLLMIATKDPGLVRITFEVFRPSKATIFVGDSLYDDSQGTSTPPAIQGQISDYAREVGMGPPRFLRVADTLEKGAEFRLECRKVVDRAIANQEDLLCEATAGKSWMKLLLARELRDQPHALVACDSQYDRNTPVIGTERYWVVDAE